MSELSQKLGPSRRITELRREIWRCFANGRPISASEICEQLRNAGYRPNKTSVYRELELLMGQGLIVPVTFGDRILRYERADLSHHHHLVCQSCRHVSDVECVAGIADAKRLIAHKTGFAVERHSLEFFGLCQQCQKQGVKP